MGTPYRAIALVYAALALSIACKSEDPDPPELPCSLAQDGAACSAHGDCCSGSCQNQICVSTACAQNGTACAAPASCCSGNCQNQVCAPVATCTPNGAACAAPADCCSGACNGATCVPAGSCGSVGAACDEPTDCCTGNCPSGACAEPDTGCVLLAGDCTTGTQCCTGLCASGKCAVPTTPSCGDPGDACTSDAQCCSGACDDATHKCSNAAGTCGYPGERCATDSDCCSQNCPNAGTAGATCSAALCRQASQSCADSTQCCSGICGAGGLCAVLPAGSTGATCKTLGESCVGAADCCSTNCQGGICRPAASCNASGDVCVRAEDCCSGLCAQTAAGAPGRCEDASGGCGLDGYPCTSDSNCCTKKCVDLGTGATVCQPSGGCRMTGNYCDSTASCCGGTNEANPTQPSGYGVFCDGPGTSPGAPQWDTRTQDDRTCTGGQSCNPPGNVCGYKSSQNCCHEGNGSGTQVCRFDVNGIQRCFGGLAVKPGTCTPSPGQPCCERGWDGNDPLCCKPAGEICQFRDQCCGMAPCVPDAQGVLRCGASGPTCLPRGAICSTDPQPNGNYTPVQGACCDGSLCRWVSELGWACSDSIPGGGGTCSRAGEACGGSNPACCFGDCVSGVCGASCAPFGGSCSTNAECCSGVCDGTTCRAACVTETGSCTVSADCCDGLTCDVPAGATSGTCTSGGSSTCAPTGLSCATDACCNPADTCTGGVCTPPAPVCSDVRDMCTAGGNECCDTLQCYTMNWLTEEREACTATSTDCFCDAVTSCAPLNQPCSTGAACCPGTICLQNAGGAACASADPAQCTCRPIG